MDLFEHSGLIQTKYQTNLHTSHKNASYSSS